MKWALIFISSSIAAIFVTFEEYFQERKAVEARFRAAVEKRWNEKPSLHCTLDQFHLGR